MTMLTMVMPAYNEEALIYENAVRAVRRLKEISRQLDVDVKLAVLDDGSTDGTREQVARVQVMHPEVEYYRRSGPSRRENLAKLMIELDAEFVGWMDADLATSLDYLEELIAAAPRHDIVTGSRYLPSSQINRTFERLFISRAYNGLVRFAFGSRISDHWCGFKIFRRSALEDIIAHIGTDNAERQMFWDAQMWLVAQRMNLSILEIPVAWTEGEKSALRVHTELPMALFTFKYWVSSGCGRRVLNARAGGAGHRSVMQGSQYLREGSLR